MSASCGRGSCTSTRAGSLSAVMLRGFGGPARGVGERNPGAGDAATGWSFLR